MSSMRGRVTFLEKRGGGLGKLRLGRECLDLEDGRR